MSFTLFHFELNELHMYTANIYSQFTVIGCVTCANVIWQCTEADEHREPGEFNLAQNLIFQTFYCRNKQ